MADTPTKDGPASATGGEGQSEKGGTAAPAGVTSEQILERLEALDKKQDNFRSLHDRQLDDIRRSMTASRSTGQDDYGDGDDGSGDAPARSARPKMTQRELLDMRDRSITKFKVDHPDWQEYWQDIEEIGGDTARSKRFVRYSSDPDTGELIPDFYASLVDIREHVETQRLRKKLEDGTPENQQASEQANQARSDAAAIGGSPASLPKEVLGEDFKKLPYNEKIKKLAALGLLDYDPSDPPEALR
jgi:hypothetical protein